MSRDTLRSRVRPSKTRGPATNLLCLAFAPGFLVPVDAFRSLTVAAPPESDEPYNRKVENAPDLKLPSGDCGTMSRQTTFARTTATAAIVSMQRDPHGEISPDAG